MEERFQTFTVLITNLSRSIHKIKTEEMAKFNLKSSHVSCLYYLYKERTLTAKELCDICEEDKANVSRSLKYLEQNGYLMCESATRKRYQSPLGLTEKGREVGRRIAERIDSILKKASEGLDEASREIMYRCLTSVSRNLQTLCHNEKQVVRKGMEC